MTAPAEDHNVVHANHRQRRRLLTLVAASIVVALGLAEVLFRAAGFDRGGYEPRRFESPTGGVPFEMIPLPGGRKFFAYRPETEFASIYDPRGDARGYLGRSGRIDYRIDGLGMRRHAKPESLVTGPKVLCLGDSFTFGEGVREGDTYPAQLEKFLNKDAAGVAVFNGGVQGYGTGQALIFFERTGRALKPDLVILGFVLNDACDVGETIAQNDAMTRAFEPSTIGGLSAIWRTLERRRHQSQLQSAFFRQIRRGFNSVEWDHCRAVLERFHALANEDGFEFLVVIFPIFWQLDGNYPFDDLHAKVAQACRDANCEYIDLRDQFRDRPSQDFWVHPTDQHPNEIAHERVARAIAPRVVELLQSKKAESRP